MVQQAVILAMTCSNMIHMYIISSIGDDVAESVGQVIYYYISYDFFLFQSSAAAEAIENESLWEANKRDKLDLLQVAVRCTRPYYIVFGDNRKLCASSFGDVSLIKKTI